jgi:hypothetical protein
LPRSLLPINNLINFAHLYYRSLYSTTRASLLNLFAAVLNFLMRNDINSRSHGKNLKTMTLMTSHLKLTCILVHPLGLSSA